MMPSQRVRDAGSRAGNKSSNGPLRVQSKAKAEYSATCGIRQLPGICWYSVKSMGKPMNARWHRG